MIGKYFVGRGVDKVCGSCRMDDYEGKFGENVMLLTRLMAFVMALVIGAWLMVALIHGTVVWWKPVLIFGGLYVFILTITAIFETEFCQ